MSDFDLAKASPNSVYMDYCRNDQLAFQRSPSGQAIFYPRIVEPKTGNNLSWEVSQGLGTVYSTTVIYLRDEKPYNVALIDVDEGYRMMSRVEGVDPEDVRIGMRVQVKMVTFDDGKKYPIFSPVKEAI
ncbi:Zn-ribbon domain-containing OB-fold protein [Polynucleobacter sp. MWH-Aus1W21]|uniref:Zn-ribbon domain-containing OB-fold protein n=1 Tax=Polynucleobacter sp. MWH-Aus1W21 TaxID=1855880 RepID=UPI00203FC6B5|nr:OB-fold domain-containing protein [Polynucleobacter sp. MWH-Aus1W21]